MTLLEAFWADMNCPIIMRYFPRNAYIYKSIYDRVYIIRVKLFRRSCRESSRRSMKLFRVIIFNFYVSMGFRTLDTFVAVDNTIMMSSRGPEMFPILRSRKCLHTFHSKHDCERMVNAN